MSSQSTDTAHAALMDSTYRYQRLVYDATRAYYLLGRDHLIAELRPPQHGHVIEIACGTGRNLRRVEKAYPGCALYGLDISDEMLRTARAQLRNRAQLARGDACAFDPQALYARAKFDRVILSYSLSMIPDWRAAIDMATTLLAEGGELHIVDFGGQSRLPGWFKTALRAWLARFHVTPRDDLVGCIAKVARKKHLQAETTPLFRDYARYAKLRAA